MTEPTPAKNQDPQGGNSNAGEQTPDAGQEFKAITSQEELNRIIGERVKRAKPADYDDLKAKAVRLDEIEQANKSELQKAQDAAAEAARKLAEAQTESLRFRIAAKHNITDEDADLFLTGKDEETLTRQAQRLAAHAEAAGKPRAPQPDPNQGRDNHPRASTADAFAAAVSEVLNP